MPSPTRPASVSRNTHTQSTDCTSYLPVEKGFTTGNWATRVRRRVIFMDFLAGCWGAVAEVVGISCGANFGEVQGSASGSEVNGPSSTQLLRVDNRRVSLKFRDGAYPNADISPS